MKKHIWICLVWLFALGASAQESQQAYNFLRLPVSAHSAALGGENITLVEDDASLMFANPALLSSVSDRTINLNYMNYMEGTHVVSASFNRTVKEKASVAVSAQLINYGSIKEVDENNVQTGEFSAREFAVGAYLSYMLSEKIAGGITAKFISSTMGNYSSFAMGIDLGINYYDPEKEWSLSLVAKNLGGQLKAYEDEYESIPFNLQAGVSKRFENAPFRISATFSELTNWERPFIEHLSAGVDFLLGEQFWIGAGYNFRRAKEMKIQSSDGESNHGAGLSFGAGLQLERFKLGLSYGKYHVSSSSIIANISFTL
ncbi:MAG: type IX secretion system protein PorQ [Prevotella sp.]|nr:type IX secretion system protein PorQ [Prevotella sp.]